MPPKKNSTKKSPKKSSKKSKTSTSVTSDPLYLFYTSLLRQKPNSEMAIRWCMKHKCHQLLEKYANKKKWQALKTLDHKDLHKTVLPNICKNSNKYKPVGVKAISTTKNSKKKIDSFFF